MLVKIFFELIKSIIRFISVVIASYLIIRILAYIGGNALSFYLDWNQITLSIEDRNLLFLITDALMFYSFVFLVLLLSIFSRLRRKILFF